MIRPLAAAALLLPLASPGAPDPVAANQALIDRAAQRWEVSPHGPMLARILPPAVEPARLPDPRSEGARLLARYCAQCHHLPKPGMHSAERWPKVVRRMVDRMEGKGNLGALMRDMMGDVGAPREEEIHVLLAYLQRYAQQSLDPQRYPDLATRGASFREACSQCHALPDPRSRSAREWPEIVARMERNMAWMNRVVGSRPDPREPQLRVDEILAYLKRHAAP